MPALALRYLLACGRPACFLLAPVTASAAGLIAAYEQYVTGQGFDIRMVNAATGTQISVPAGVNTPDDDICHLDVLLDGSSSSSRGCDCCRSSTATSCRRPSGP